MSPHETKNDLRLALHPVLSVASVVAVLAMATAMAQGGPVRMARVWSIEQVLLETALGGCGTICGPHHGRHVMNIFIADSSAGVEAGQAQGATWNPSGQCVTRVCGIGLAPMTAHPDLEFVAHRVAGLSPPRSSSHD